jgi:signal transduction histidine kinase
LKVDLGGKERWFSLSAVPVLERGVQLSGWRGSARDVTELILAEQARDSETHRLRTLVNLVPGSLYQFKVDRQGVASFPFATPGLESLLGVSLAEVAVDAAELFGRIHPADRGRVQQSIERSRQLLEPWRESFRISLPTGQERHLSAHSMPQADEEGAVVWHGLVTDETEQVADRLNRDRLQRERDHALRESRARSEALSRVSHELRTPLNAILGFTQLMQHSLRQGAISAETWGPWLQHLHRAATHLLGVTDSVLDQASLQERRFAVDLQPLDSAEIARQAMELIRPQAEARGLRLEYANCESSGGDSCQPEARVVADKRALRQVFLNLLSNASKYTPPGGRIRLSCNEAGRFWRWEVSDDGPGISPELQARLFHPFERGSQRTGGEDGTGLGLIISRKLMQSMRGTLTLQSCVGEGATFSLELPRAESEGDDAMAQQASTSLFGGLEEPRGGASMVLPDALLLYVEDDPVNGLLMQEFVARTPRLRLHIAATVSEGLEAALRLSPDLILLDMHLPDGTGADFLEKLRKTVRRELPRIVMLSADAMADREETIKALKVHDYWTKPLDFGFLKRRLLDVLS